MIKNKRSQKPIEHDVHLKYMCPECGEHHWLSFRESSTKNFKIVCFCGLVFGVKRTKNIRIIFEKKKNSLPQSSEKIVEKPKIEMPIIPNELLEQTIKALVIYGFRKSEAKEIITKSYEKSPVDNASGLVKQILESFRNK